MLECPRMDKYIVFAFKATVLQEVGELAWLKVSPTVCKVLVLTDIPFDTTIDDIYFSKLAYNGFYIEICLEEISRPTSFVTWWHICGVYVVKSSG